VPESYSDTPLLTERFTAAVQMAAQVHARQLRKGTSIPYLSHPLSVAALTLEHGGGEEAAMAAVLHDVIEDASDGRAAEAAIRHAFGDHVADVVRGCSDAVGRVDGTKPPWKQRKSETLRHLRGVTDPDILLVSACDKLHNSRCLLADLRAGDDSVWSRFNAPREDQLWYYRGLVAALRGRVPPALHRELERTVSEIAVLAAPRPPEPQLA
jgi:(p)ppGpp synthase/HD superfamily hydrolase